jgi:SAM-dependent methyltransferase
MIEEYMPNSEYKTHFEKLRGLRSRIAGDLPFKARIHILDVATGEGYFAIDVARLDRSLKITGIDISQEAIRDAIKNVKKQGFQDRIKIVEMDATKLCFQSEEFDMAINFTGLDEIHLTRGSDGVQKTFLEVNRVLKPRTYFCFVVMPPEEMETDAQKLEVSLVDYICGAKYLSSKEYEAVIKKAKFKLIRKRGYYTGMKFTPQQAKGEIRYIIKNVPRIYGVKTPSFEEVWTKFGQYIEKNGLGCYSKVVLMVAQKVGDV